MFTAIRYDGLGRRLAIDEGSNGVVTGETRYGWCGETLCQARAANDAPAKRYLTEGEADLGNNLALYYGVDQLGSVRDVIAMSDGLRMAHFDYQPYGSPTTTLGSGLGWTDFRYAGLFLHPESGLYLATYRAYDPTAGRWLARDPLAEFAGSNLYAYAESSPVVLTDPTGEIAVLDNVLAGLANVGFSYALHRIEGQCYTVGDFIFDFAIGAGTNGLSVLAKLRLLSKLGKAAPEAVALGEGVGGVVAKDGLEITGYTEHGVQRAIGDGAERAGTSPQAILDALKNPSSIKNGVDSLGRPYRIYVGSTGRVVVNPVTGRIVSVNPLSGGGVR